MAAADILLHEFEIVSGLLHKIEAISYPVVFSYILVYNIEIDWHYRNVAHTLSKAAPGNL